eukprot:5296510-Pleurochrysis_carterae.AAC.2
MTSRTYSTSSRRSRQTTSCNGAAGAAPRRGRCADGLDRGAWRLGGEGGEGHARGGGVAARDAAVERAGRGVHAAATHPAWGEG